MCGVKCMSTLERLNQKFKLFLINKCNHQNVDQFSSNSHCPDCGQKIKISWIMLRCGNCKAPRMPLVDKRGKIVPKEKYCSKCGADVWFLSRAENLKFTEYKYGIIRKNVVTEESTSGKSRTDVWVEGEPQEIKRSSNVIKAHEYFARKTSH